MTIEEVSIVTRTELVVKHTPTRASNEKWTCSFDKTDVREGGFLVGVYGEGNSAEEAIRNYIWKIQGKELAIGASGAHRKDFDLRDIDLVY